MKYILEGNDKELERVIKESRIRINRGLISITPISECGLITEEDARKTLKEQFDIHDVKVQELVSSLEEKNSLISVLEEQCDGFKVRIAELENINTLMGDDKGLQESDLTALIGTDTKWLVLEDTTVLPTPDVKEVVTGVNEVATQDDVKKPGRGRPAKQ